ncbi:hypothetical protein MKW98_010510 [Papaver atlanticum]|uniref:TF-B3 domain-containing protein n=1 Tax=Papaver atlanticum TaxID=357466 RepID=A0AAD4S8B1_9MAGN|nr:hypothetical protein MKW98_010510 [Papaver atlanticum]
MEKFVYPDRTHHFYKVLLKEDETRMRIPETFYPRISRESQSCEWAVVQGLGGAHWVTKVNKTQDGIYLEEGWEVFVQENGLQMYDYLVFKYHGCMQFSVKVFTMSGGIPRKECLAPVRASPLSEERDESDEDDEDVSGANGIEPRFISRSSSRFFRITVQPSYLKCNYLPIPWGVRREHFHDDLKKVKIVNSDASDARAWRIKILRLKNDIRLSRGVADFANKKNGLNLKVGDVCHFKIVKKRSHKLVLQVQVLRD